MPFLHRRQFLQASAAAAVTVRGRALDCDSELMLGHPSVAHSRTLATGLTAPVAPGPHGSVVVAAEEQAVSEAALDYIDGSFSGDADRMARLLDLPGDGPIGLGTALVVRCYPALPEKGS